MEYIEEEPKSASLFSLHVLISLIVLIVTQMAFKEAAANLWGVEDVSFGPYKFFMLSICCFSFLILLFFGYTFTKDNLFLWYAVFFVFTAMLSTIIAGLYSMVTLPFKFISLSYWVWILIISYYSVLHLNTFKYHIAIVFIFLPIVFFLFFAMMETSRGVGSSTMMALNPVFYISFLLPAVLLVRSKTLKIGGVLLIFAAILISYKRSAIVSFVTAIPVYFYARSVINTDAKLKKLMQYAIGGLFLLALLAFSFSFLSGAIGLDWGGRMENLIAGGGAGRVERYLGYLSLMSSQSAQSWIVGHGYYATHFTSLDWPHNDIIEVAFDFGLGGLTFYLLFIGQLARIFFEMKKYKYRHFDAFAVSLVIFFWGTMLSMLIILPYWFLNLAFFWGWVIADFHNAKAYGDPEKIGNPLYAYAYEDEYGDCYGDEHEDVYVDEYEEYPWRTVPP